MARGGRFGNRHVLWLLLCFFFVSVCAMSGSMPLKDLFSTTTTTTPDNDNSFNCNWNYKNGWDSGPVCPYAAIKGLVSGMPINPSNFANLSAALSLVETFGTRLVEGLKTQLGISTGASVFVVYDQDVWMNKGYGTVDKNVNVTPTPDTIYQIGSITKIFTSLMLFHLIEKGAVSVDSPVRDFYNQQNPPAFNLQSDPYGDPGDITMHMLATHSSGLPRESPLGPYQPNVTEAQLFQIFAEGVPMWFPPYKQPHYSNLGIALLGRCLARAANASYEDYLVDNLFSQIGMNSSGFYYNADVISRMATGYNIEGRQQIPPRTNTETMGWTNPCGGAYSTANDFIAFMKFLFAGGKDGILKEPSIREYFLPGVQFSDMISGYGLGTWEQFYVNNGHLAMTKGGLTGGFGSNIVIFPELKLGYGILLNINSGILTSRATESITQVLLPPFLAALQSLQPQPPLPANIKGFLGTYGNKATGHVFLQLSMSNPQGILQGTLLGFPIPLRFVWDQSQSNSEFIGLRYDELTPSLSCSTRDGLGLPGVLYLFSAQGINYFTAPDVLLYNQPQLNT